MLQQILSHEILKLKDNYKVCGFVDKQGVIYPLGADTKVLSTVFELVCRPAVFETAR